MADSPNETTDAPPKMTGAAITLQSGAVVALFPQCEPGASLMVFTAPDGEKTRVKVSDAALEALAALIVSAVGQEATYRGEIVA